MSLSLNLNRVPSFQELEVKQMAGGHYVDLAQLLDIVDKRAMLLMRQLASPNCPSHSTGALQGRIQELTELYEPMSKQND